MSARRGRAASDAEVLRLCFPTVVRDGGRGMPATDEDYAARIAEVDAMEADRKARWAAMPLPSTGGRK